MQPGWTAVQEPRPQIHDPRVLTGPTVSWWGPRSADTRDQLQLATMTGGTPAFCRGWDSAGGRSAGQTLLRWDVRGAKVRRGVELEEFAGVVALRPAARTQEPEVANLSEPRGTTCCSVNDRLKFPRA